MMLVRAKSRRKSTNLTLDENLVAEARALKVNISRVAEEGIAKAVAAERSRVWKEENRAGIDGLRKYFEENGIPLDEFRQF